MKNITYIIVLVVFFLFSYVFSYTPNTNDNIIVSKIQTIIDNNINQTDNQKLSLVDWYYIFDKVQLLQTPGTRIDYIIKQIKNNLRLDIDGQKQSDQNSKLIEQTVSKYFGNITTNTKNLPDRCFEYQELVDDMARGLDIPTALVVASRQIEAGCNFATYKNGIFQIMANNYKGQKMTKSLLIQQIKDFDKFIRHKRNRYNRANKNKGGETISMSYSNWSVASLIKHGALYNGLSGRNIIGDIQPMQSYYVYGNLNFQHSDVIKDGLIVNFVKYLKGND